jgi:dTDP-4-dehydrorhamnose reductase
MVLILGANGQVALSLKELLTLNKTCFLSSKEINFLNPEELINKIQTLNPSLIINAAAYTAVDQAENERSASKIINAITPGMIASWCENNRAKLIHFSTDYIFNGTGESPWSELSKPSPINYYGETKLLGEQLILNNCSNSYIFRISWVYSPWGKNFVKTILRLAQEREELSIVSDQIGSPTDSREVALFIKNIIEQNNNSLHIKIPPGIANLSFQKWVSWYDFAKAIVARAQNQGMELKVKSILPISSDKFPTPAARPKNSRLISIRPEVNEKIELVKIESLKNQWSYF